MLASSQPPGHCDAGPEGPRGWDRVLMSQFATELLRTAFEGTAELEQDRDAVVDALRDACLSVDGGISWKIDVFGSALTGLCEGSIDIDVTICTGVGAGPSCKAHSNEMLGRLARAVGKSDVLRVQEHVRRARIPILKMTMQPTQARREAASSGQDVPWCTKDGRGVDLSLDNTMAVTNSRLVRAYARLHPAVACFLVLLRKWTKVAGVHGAMAGFFGSYPWTLIGIWFLQSSSLVPILDASMPFPADPAETGTGGSFVRPSESERAFAEGKLRDVVLDELLCQCFTKLSQLKSNDVLNIAGSRHDRGCARRRDPEQWALVDPFESSRNLSDFLSDDSSGAHCSGAHIRAMLREAAQAVRTAPSPEDAVRKLFTADPRGSRVVSRPIWLA